MKKPFEKKQRTKNFMGIRKRRLTVDEPKWSGCHPIKVCRNKKHIIKSNWKKIVTAQTNNSSDISAANQKKHNFSLEISFG